jgi:hypothetical protein
MKALVVYESMFGNTEQIGRAFADGLSESLDVQVVEVADAPAELDPDPRSTPRLSACATCLGLPQKGAAKQARRHGYESAAKAESFYVHDTDSPLLEGEIDRAGARGRQLGASLTNATT